MEISGIIERVLEESLRALPGDLRTRSARLTRAAADLSNDQRQGEQPGEVDYSGQYRRLAYVYKHTLPRAFAVYNLLKAHSASFVPLRQKLNVSVCSIGAGPGSDTLGVLKYLSFLGRLDEVRLTYWLVDRYAGWKDSWISIKNQLPTGMAFDDHYKVFNVEDFDGTLGQHPEFHCDIIMCIYNGIEMHRREVFTAPYLTRLFQCAAPGTCFVYMDAYHNGLIWWMVDLAREAGFVMSDLCHINCNRGSEWQHDLAEFQQFFGHTPSWNADGIYFYAIKQPT